MPLLDEDVQNLAADALILQCDDAGLALMPGTGASGEVRISFGSAGNQRRAQQGKQLLVKAIGGGIPRPRVLDATAGLGRDAGVLHRFGFPLLLIERNPVLHAMLADAISRLPDAVTDALTLINSDAAAWMQSCAADQRPDVVYLDPMYPDSGKSAATKKELNYLRLLLGEADDGALLLEAALACARYRVVVKRPPKALNLGGRAPAFTVAGKAVRFDVYPLQAYPKH